MKTMLLLTALLINTSAFAAPKISSFNTYGSKKTKTGHVLIINIDQLRNQTKDVSLLKPVFLIVTELENARDKFHGRKLKITYNKIFAGCD